MFSLSLTLVERVVSVLELVSGQEQEDAAGVGGETAHDMGERAEGEAPRLLHQQRVLVRRLLPVGGVSGRIVPRPVEATRRHLIPHCEREASSLSIYTMSAYVEYNVVAK